MKYGSDRESIGVASTLTVVYGEEFRLWLPQHKPIFDVFDEIKPTTYFTKDVSSIEEKLVKEYNSSLIELSGEAVEYGNIAQFNNGIYQREFDSECLYYSMRKPNDELLDLLHFVGNRYKLKIFGNYKIDIPFYLGQITVNQLNNAYASTKVNLDFGNDSRFDAILNHAVSALSVEDIPIIMEEKLRKKKLKEFRKQVIDKQTYFHYTASLFKKLKRNEDAKKILDKLAELV